VIERGEVVVTGASGFVGRAAVRELLGRSWSVIGVSRDPDRARRSAPPAVRWIPFGGGALEEAVAACGRCVNLVGQHPFEGRWNDAYKEEMRRSRVGTTTRVVQALARSTASDRVLVNASGVVYYGDCGEEIVSESRPPDPDAFVSRMCSEWEAAAAAARPSGVRVVVVRIGLGLGRDGGALPMIARPFRFGLGGHVGSGRQYVPWIHNDDLAGLIAEALEDPAYEGAYNGAAPHPVTGRELARALGAAMHRPSRLPMPARVLELVVGEASGIMLWSCRADTARIARHGFSFRHPTIEDALAALYP
jgi:uncharacterized protein (TIGR01777 family)